MGTLSTQKRKSQNLCLGQKCFPSCTRPLVDPVEGSQSRRPAWESSSWLVSHRPQRRCSCSQDCIQLLGSWKLDGASGHFKICQSFLWYRSGLARSLFLDSPARSWLTVVDSLLCWYWCCLGLSHGTRKLDHSWRSYARIHTRAEGTLTRPLGIFLRSDFSKSLRVRS